MITNTGVTPTTGNIAQDIISDGVGQFGYTARQAEEASRGGQVKDFGIGAIIAAAITAAASIGMGIWQAKKQNQYNQEMVDKQNEYNSPASQMERYRAAGINPYLAMQQGGVSAGVQDAPVEKKTFDPKHMQLDQLLPLLSLTSQLAVNKANISKMEAQSLLYAAQAQTESAKQYNLYEQGRKAAKWTDKVADAQIGLITSQKEMVDVNVKFAPLEKLAKINLMNADASLKTQLITRIQFQNNLDEARAKQAYQEIAESQARMLKIKAEIEKIKSEINVNVQKVNNMKEQKTLLELDQDYRKAQTDYTKQMESYFGTQEQWIPFNAATGVINALW